MRSSRRILRIGSLGAVFLFLPLLIDAQTVEPDRTLVLKTTVTPDPAPIGVALSFRLSVTNTGSRPATFSLDGCPVHYRLDGRFSPATGCKEIRRTLELGPGESVTFGPEETPHLLFDPSLYPLGPGRHRLIMAIEELGGATTEFRVLAPTDLAFVGGRVLTQDREAVASGLVYLHPEDGSPGPKEEEEILRVPLSPQGYFLLPALNPGNYTIEVETESGTFWYPGAPGSAGAQPLTLSARDYRDLELVFPGGKTTFPVTGMVFESPGNGETVPLEGAVVVAIPESSPLDAALLPPGRPTPSLAWPRTRTGEDGVFRLDLPPGTYRLLAGKLGKFRYRYWSPGEKPGGEGVRIPGPTSGEPIRFDLIPLRDAPLSVLEGSVFGESRTPGELPNPVEGAEVEAISILPSEITAAPQRTRTGADGIFNLEVPADTPYLVRAGARGFQPRFHRNTSRAETAEWVESAPGTRVRDLMFFLSTLGVRDRGALEGSVFRQGSDEDCGEEPGCLVAVSNTWVRVVPSYGGFGPREYRTRTGADGRFRLEDLPGDRTYFVSAEGRNREQAYVPEGAPFSRAREVEVLPRKTVNAGRIILSSRAGRGGADLEGFLGGSVTDKAGRPLPGFTVRVHLEPKLPGGPVISTRTDADGDFWISGLPPETPVLVSAAGPGHIPVYYPDVHRWADGDRIVTGGPANRIQPVSIQLARNAEGGPCRMGARVEAAPEFSPSLEVMVLSSTRPHPLEGAFFYLLDPATGAPVAGAQTAANGTVFLTGLPEGAFVLGADRPGYSTGDSPGSESPPSPAVLQGEEPNTIVTALLHPMAEARGENTTPELGILSAVGNAPNPFRPVTRIRYRLERPAPVSLQVFDYRGRLVRTLLQEEEQSAGPQQVSWDATGEDGQRVSSGVYFFRVLAGTTSMSRKIVVLP